MDLALLSIAATVHSPVEDVPRYLDVSQHSEEHEEALQTSQPSTKDVHQEVHRRSPSPTEERRITHSPLISEHEQSFEREQQREEEEVLATSQTSIKEHQEEDFAPRPIPIAATVHSPVEDVPRSLDVSQHSEEHEEALQTSQSSTKDIHEAAQRRSSSPREEQHVTHSPVISEHEQSFVREQQREEEEVLATSQSSTNDIHEEVQRRSPSISEHEDETQVKTSPREEQVTSELYHPEAEDEVDDLHRSHEQSFEHESQRDEEEVLATPQSSTKEHQEEDFEPRPTRITATIHSPVEDVPRSLDVSQHSEEHEEVLATSQSSEKEEEIKQKSRSSRRDHPFTSRRCATFFGLILTEAKKKKTTTTTRKRKPSTPSVRATVHSPVEEGPSIFG